MSLESNILRNLMVLTLGLVIVFAVPASVPAQESDPAVASPAPQAGERGGCGCAGRMGAEGAPGGFCRGGGPGGQGAGMGHRGGGDAGMHNRGAGKRHSGGGMGQGGRGVMEATHALVHDYRRHLVREVQDVENGVVTVTRAPENREAAAMLRRHVDEMKGLLVGGGRVRAWDPLFTEIFDHADEIEMEIEALEDGVRVTETSANPEVVKLIRAHARKVSAFIARGPAAVHEPTELPEGYVGRRTE